MLVKLYALPDPAPHLADLASQSIEIRLGRAGEKPLIMDWVRHHFSDGWALGCQWSLLRDPASCYIAVEKEMPYVPSSEPYATRKETLLGFACYDASVRGMFGPLGVREDYQNRGIGRALLLTCLHAMWRETYAYAVIGWAGPVDFYRKTVGATLIKDSEPGIYGRELIGVD
jgi:GNAT superfamily N-acetyltransferase